MTLDHMYALSWVLLGVNIKFRCKKLDYKAAVRDEVMVYELS